jgi:glycosyltransferase involved in cell wall biosynthesis
VVGAEPFDIRVPLFRRANRHNHIIYHTSWPYWSGNDVPRKPYLSSQKDWWKQFIEEVPTVTVTKAAKNAVEQFGGTATHIPHSVDTDLFRPDQGSSENGDTILFVGRLVEEKGIFDLINAAERISPTPQVQVVGSGPLYERIESYGGPANIELTGHVRDNERLAEIFAAADVHVLPSYKNGRWEELFGMVIIESMASGTPTVATAVLNRHKALEFTV